MNLHDVTGAMGEALKAAEANGVPVEDPNVFRYIDALRVALKNVPPDRVRVKAKALIDALQEEAAHHGNLRTQKSTRLENELRLALNETGISIP